MRLWIIGGIDESDDDLDIHLLVVSAVKQEYAEEVGREVILQQAPDCVLLDGALEIPPEIQIETEVYDSRPE